LFLDEVAKAMPTVTVESLVDLRVALLKRHHCNETLAHLGISPDPKPSPTAGAHDTWVRAGRVTGPKGFTIMVDLDSMTTAGPGKMRTWIKYHFTTLGPKREKESLVYEQLDCARRYHSTISLYAYGSSGQILYSDSGKPEDEEPIIPESMLAGILPFTCAATCSRSAAV
jgi:hypothetical protein